MSKRPIFLVSAKDKSLDELKAQAQQALLVFQQSRQPPPSQPDLTAAAREAQPPSEQSPTKSRRGVLY